MSPDDNRLGPTGYRPRHALENDRFTEHRSAQNVPNSPIGALPHALQLELFHSRLVGCDGRALDAHRVLLDRLGRVNGHLIVRGITMLYTQIIILDIQLQVWEDELRVKKASESARPGNRKHMGPIGRLG